MAQSIDLQLATLKVTKLDLNEPLHLLWPSDDHSRLVPNPEALKALSEIKGPVAVMSIVGTQRGGKSTLLNLLRNRSTTSGFKLGHTYDPKTLGLWLLAKPHPRNPDLTVLLIDTEGLDSPHVKQSYNWSLAALTLLISTCFIFQTKGCIDSHQTDRLSVILKVAEHLRGKNLTRNEEKASFLWLVRDHQLIMNQEPREEMLQKLNSSAEKALLKCFRNVDCFPLPRLAEKEEQLQHIEQTAFEDLSAAFREEYVVLERNLFKEALSPLAIGETVMTGSMVADLLSQYSQALSAKGGILNELSNLPTHHQMLVRMGGEKAVQSALAAYSSAMRAVAAKFPISPSDFFALHQRSFADAREVFVNAAAVYGTVDEPELAEYLTQFSDKVALWEEGVCMGTAGLRRESTLQSGLLTAYWAQNSKALAALEAKVLIAEFPAPDPTAHPTLAAYDTAIAAALARACEGDFAAALGTYTLTRLFNEKAQSARLALLDRLRQLGAQTHRDELQSQHQTLLTQFSDMMEKMEKRIETDTRAKLAALGVTLSAATKEETHNMKESLLKKISEVEDASLKNKGKALEVETELRGVAQRTQHLERSGEEMQEALRRAKTDLMDIDSRGQNALSRIIELERTVGGMGSLATAVGVLQEDVAALAGLSDQADTLTQRVDQVDASTTHKLQGMQASVAGAQTTAEAVQTALEALEGGVQHVRDSIAAFWESLGTLSARMSGIEADVDVRLHDLEDLTSTSKSIRKNKRKETKMKKSESAILNVEE